MPSRSFGTQMRYTRGAWTLATGGFRTPIGSDAAAIDTDGDVEATIGSGHDLLLRAAWAWRDEARYADVQAAVLTVGQQPIAAFRNISGRSERRIAGLGAAIGWVPSSLTRLSVAYDITAADGLRRVREHALMLRVQQAS